MQTAVGLSTESLVQGFSVILMSAAAPFLSLSPQLAVFPCQRLVHHCQQLMLWCSHSPHSSPIPCAAQEFLFKFVSIPFSPHDATRKHGMKSCLAEGVSTVRGLTVVNIAKVIETEMRLRRLAGGGWGESSGESVLCFWGHPRLELDQINQVHWKRSWFLLTQHCGYKTMRGCCP